jgi:hypothetical protein
MFIFETSVFFKIKPLSLFQLFYIDVFVYKATPFYSNIVYRIEIQYYRIIPFRA